MPLRTHRYRFLAGVLPLVLLALLAACTPGPMPWTHTYTGPSLPDSEVAILVHRFSNYREVLVIDQVSYHKTRDDPKTLYKLRPGRHHIRYTLRWFKSGFVHGWFEVDMQAGHTYILSHDREGLLPRSRRVIVTLEDSTTGKVVAQERFGQPSWYMQ